LVLGEPELLVDGVSDFRLGQRHTRVTPVAGPIELGVIERGKLLKSFGFVKGGHGAAQGSVKVVQVYENTVK
jgi:hypothetical protein